MGGSKVNTLGPVEAKRDFIKSCLNNIDGAMLQVLADFAAHQAKRGLPDFERLVKEPKNDRNR
jgi:hypothetical protein